MGGGKLLNIAIVEDNNADAEILESYIKSYMDQDGVEHHVERFSDASSFLKEYKPIFDIIFMDIELPDDNGMNLAKKLRTIDDFTMIIFVTNMSQFAVNGYEVNAFDFIVKPVNYLTFAMKMNRAVRHLSRVKDMSVSIKTDTGTVFVSASKIKFVETQNHGVIYHLSDGAQIVSRDAMKNVEGVLKEESGFFKCNRCYLVNLRYVDKVDSSVVVIDGNELLISRPRKKEFLLAVAKFFGGGD